MTTVTVRPVREIVSATVEGKDGLEYPKVHQIPNCGYCRDGAHCVHGWGDPVYSGNAHVEAEQVGQPTCLTRGPEAEIGQPSTFSGVLDLQGRYSCAACAVEEGLAIMIRWERDVAGEIAHHARGAAERLVLNMSATNLAHDAAERVLWAKSWAEIGQFID